MKYHFNMLKKKIIMAFVSMMLDIPIREIRSESQKRELVEARVIFVTYAISEA